MADTISFASFAEMKAGLEGLNAQVSGMTWAEAESALGTTVAENGWRLVGQTWQSGSDAVINFPNAQTAAEAFEQFQQSGGLEAASNAATQATSIGAGSVALVKSGEVVSTAGVLTGSAGIAAAAAAPIAGAAIGVGLYAAAPDFWEEVSRLAFPQLWNLTDAMPMLVDSLGRTYMQKNTVEAIRAILEATGEIELDQYVPRNNNWALQYNDYDMPIQFTASVPEAFPFFGYTSNSTVYWMRGMPEGVLALYYGTRISWIFLPATPIRTLADWQEATSTWECAYVNGTNPPAESDWTLYNAGGAQTAIYIDGENYYITGTGLYGYRPIFEVPQITRNHSATAQVPQKDITKLYYNQEITPDPTYPTIPWTGDAYPDNPNTIDVLTGYDELGNPQFDTYQQVALPIGDPLVTNDPLIQPSPYTNPLPEIDPDTGAEVYPAIDPYINPYPKPEFFPEPNDIPEGEPGHIGDPNLTPAPLPSVEEVPLPAIETVPDPAVDPSAEPVPDAEPANPIQPAGPTSGGSSPSPTIPLFPPFPDGNASLYHVYNPTNAQLQQFGSWLWTTFSGNLIDTLSKLFNNPMDAVISLQEFYYTPNIQGQGTIRCGYLDSQVPSALVGNRYSVLNCGSIIIPEYWGNYLDYSPYSQVIVYLPFIGFMSLNADDVIGNAVNITYHIDSYTGSVIAIITVARQGYESVVYQFEGNCSVDVPVTGGQQSSIKGAIIGGISGAVMGGVPGAIAGAAIGGLSTKNDVQHSGSFSSSYGAMGAKVPFIVVRRPVQKVVYNYNESYGYQAHKMVYVGNCRGYLRAKEVRVLSTKATNEEKEMIVNALKAGVYVKN